MSIASARRHLRHGGDGEGRSTYRRCGDRGGGGGGECREAWQSRVSSSCGSADLLAELGVNIDLDAPRMSRVLRNRDRVLFAPKLHPAMSAVVAVRKELGLRTISTSSVR